MVLCLKVKKELGQKAIIELKKLKLFNADFALGRTAKQLIVPVTKHPDANFVKKYSAEILNRNLNLIKDTSPKTFKEALKGILKPEEIEKVNSSYDIIGDIAVIDFDDSLNNLETTIAWTLKRTHKNVEVVAKRGKKTEGEFRIRKIEPIVGEKRTETIHRENNISLKMDLNKVYYSSRYGPERQRLLKKVKDGENILVMFAGVGPFPIVFAKRKNVAVWANELNPDAVFYLKENIKLNKVEKKIKIIPGDAHKEIPKLKEKFDRIVMPLPHEAHKFIKDALKVSKKGTLIHIYQFEREEKIQDMEKRILQEFKKNKANVKVLEVFRTGYFGPGINRYCLDLKVL